MLQKAKEFAWDTELEMERLDVVAEGSANAGNDVGGDVEGNEADNNEHAGNVQEKYVIQSHVDQTWVLHVHASFHTANGGHTMRKPKMTDKNVEKNVGKPC